MLLRFPAWKVALLLVTLLLGALACLPNMLSEQQRAQYLSWLPVKPPQLSRNVAALCSMCSSASKSASAFDISYSSLLSASSLFR